MQENRVDDLRHDELRELRRLLAAINDRLDHRDREPPHPAPLIVQQQSKSNDPLVCRAAEIYRQRRKREAVFGSHADLLGEPGWDLLLDLFVARRCNQILSVTAACIGAIAPPTTGLRWLSLLEGRGLVARAVDPHDKRRTYVHLTDAGDRLMELCIAATPARSGERKHGNERGE